MTEINFLKSARCESDTSSPIRLADETAVHGQFFGQSSLSKKAVVTEKSVVKVDARPDELKYLPPLGCGYLTGAGTVLNVLKPQKDESIMIIGMGAVGLAALMAAKALSLQRIIAVHLLDTKLQMASSLGATDLINTAQSLGLENTIQNIMPHGLNFVLDTTGAGMLLEASVKCLAHAGTLALVGVPPSRTNLNINALDMLVSCKSIIGVIEGRSNPHVVSLFLRPRSKYFSDIHEAKIQQGIPRLFQMFREGKMPIDRLAKIYPADTLDKALQDLKSGQVSGHFT
jgi:Zn-dependent alcohol dehydrogenase